jgi:hypothetical protein
MNDPMRAAMSFMISEIRQWPAVQVSGFNKSYNIAKILPNICHRQYH